MVRNQKRPILNYLIIYMLIVLLFAACKINLPDESSAESSEESSPGSRMIVPDVCSMEASNALELLQSMGFRVVIKGNPDESCYEDFIVMEQYPQGGEEADENCEVILEVQKIREKVEFRDPVVEAAARKALNLHQGNIYMDDLETVKELIIFSKNIDYPVDLGKFKNLEKLELMDNGIKDFGFLKDNSMLKILSIISNECTDLESIKHLELLEELSISSCPINEISFLYDLKQLKKFCIGQTLVRDFSPIGQLPNLEVLSIARQGMECLPEFNSENKLRLLEMLEVGIRGVEGKEKLRGMGAFICKAIRVLLILVILILAHGNG
jgi:hypothetical protein